MKINQNILHGEVMSVDYETAENNYLATIKLINSSANHLHTIRAYPKNASIKMMPVKGELVYVYKAPSIITSANVNIDTYYYESAVNLYGDANNNIKSRTTQIEKTNAVGRDIIKSETGYGAEEDISDEENYENEYQNKDIKQPQLEEGDYIIEGRFGNTIRLGSTGKSSDDTEVEKNWEGDNSTDPITIINNEQIEEGEEYRYYELLHKNKTSVWLTSKQKIKFSDYDYNLKSFDEKYEKLSEYKSSQAIINSSRVIIRAGSDHIFLFSDKRVGISAKKGFNVDTEKAIFNTKKTKLGYNAKESVLLGKQTERTLVGIIDSLLEVINVLTSTYTTSNGGTPAPSNISFFNIATTKLRKLKAGIDKINSKINYVE